MAYENGNLLTVAQIFICSSLSTHQSIWILSRSRLRGQQSKQRWLNLPLHIHHLQLFWGDSEVLPTKMRHNLYPVSVLPVYLLLVGYAQNTSLRRHPGGILVREPSENQFQKHCESSSSNRHCPGTLHRVHSVGGLGLLLQAEPSQAPA